MKISNISINRKVALSMIYIIAVGFGIFSLTQLKVAMTPDIDFPYVLVSTSYSGVSPEDIENLVTRPIEEAISATENVKKISSQSSNGQSMVTMEFAWGADMNQAETNVRNNIDLISDYLPTDAGEPFIIALNPSMMPIMKISMNSAELGPAELRRLAEDKVEALLERVKGVASVTIQGGYAQQINVNLNPILLASHSLSPQSISNSIQSTAGLVSAGNIKTTEKEYNLRIYSEYRSLDQIRNVVVKSGTSRVLLKDVAVVENGYAESTSDVRVNGDQGVAIIIRKQSDANTVQAVANVKKALLKIEQTLPGDIGFNTIFDGAEFTSNSMNNLSSTAFISLIIVVFIIYMFLRSWRTSMIMALSMPVSIILTFGVLMLSNLTLNVISMAGLALAIGMLVDNSVVVLENIFRYRNNGVDIITASDQGASEMGPAIIASTLTTISVFIPVLFVPGITGQLFKEMVLTITFSLSVSLLVALTLVPMMSSVLLKAKKENKKKAPAVEKNTRKGSFSGAILNKYKKVLHWSLYNKKWVIGGSIVLFFGSFALIPLIGGEFMPDSDQGAISLSVECATGLPLSTLRATTIKIEKILKDKVPELETAMFEFGATEGFNPSGAKSNTISATLKLVPLKERNRSQKEIETILRKELDDIAGISYSFESSNIMSGATSAIELKIIGHDLVKAKAVADTFKAQMQAIPGLVDIRVNISDYIPQLDVHLKQNMLNELHLTNLQIASMISTAIQGKTVAQYRRCFTVRRQPQFQHRYRTGTAGGAEQSRCALRRWFRRPG
jgi:HAE1 family hydrophobic/amphiphilic exporter-1